MRKPIFGGAIMVVKQEDLNSQILIGSSNDFQSFVNEFTSLEFNKKLTANSDLSQEQVKQKLDIYLQEMMHGYHFVSQHLPKGKLRILEVGAGLGLLSIYLNRLGHEVVALEPANVGFDFFDVTKKEIWKTVGSNIPELNENMAEELNPEKDGKFDFIFSVNVMEHINDIKAATAAIISVLKSDGLCVNSCPNYLVPYEPHYALPMIPFARSLTRKLFDKKISRQPDVWESLNFINWFTVRKMANENNCIVVFEKELIYKAFVRLGNDEIFMARHQNGLAALIYKFLKATHTLKLLRFLPVVLSTPMIFTYRKN